MALGLVILVAVSAGADSTLVGPDAVAAHVQAALAGSAVLLAAALVIVLVVIVPASRTRYHPIDSIARDIHRP